MTISESAVRVGLIGYGFSGKTFHAPLIAAAPGLALRAVASRDPEKVHADFPEAAVHKTPVTLATSPDIDLVVIASPNPSHAPLARLALDAGKHVVVDKPFTLDLASARDLVALADAKDLILSVFHNRRWDSDFLTIRRALAQGLAGAVSQFEAHFDRFRPQVRDRWREDGSLGGGLWFDLGPHLIDQALQLFGLPDRVQANFAHQRAGARAEDWAHVVLDYGQRRAVLHAAMLVAGGTSRFVVHGEAGSLEKRHGDPQEAQLIGGMRPGDAGWGHDPDPLIVYGPNHERRTIAATPGDQSRYYTSLVDALNGRTSDAVTSIQALAVMSILEAAIESARLRRSVDLPLTAEERRRFEATAV
jgi:predicted dehydrogenase